MCTTHHPCSRNQVITLWIWDNDTLLKDLNDFRIVSPRWARQVIIDAPYLDHVKTPAAVRFLNTCFIVEMLDPQLCVSVQTLTFKTMFQCLFKGPGGCWKWKSPAGPISGFFLFPFDWLPSRLGCLNTDIFFQQRRTSEFMPKKKRLSETALPGASNHAYGGTTAGCWMGNVSKCHRALGLLWVNSSCSEWPHPKGSGWILLPRQICFASSWMYDFIYPFKMGSYHKQLL